jgi:CBS domain-containing membrane protein
MNTNSAKKQTQKLDRYLPTVGDLMTRDLFTLLPDDSLKILEELMAWQKIRHVPVIDQDQKLVGLISQRDFLKIAISKLSHLPQKEVDKVYSDIHVGEIMGKNIRKVTQDLPLRDAAQLMSRKKLGCLPVVDYENKLIGIITESDFVKSFYEWDVSFLK